jgi:DNA-directed RNA polymerase specialized sigma24 family protein
VPAGSPADRAAFSALFARHYPAVWRFVARRAWPAAIDVVVAETFLAAWRRYATSRRRAAAAAQRGGRITAGRQK